MIDRVLRKSMLLLNAFMLVNINAAYQYDLAICAIFNNERPYFKEWIEYHKLIGVQKFYLYDHLSTDNWRAVLQPYINNGQVEVINWPIKPTSQGWGIAQVPAYLDALKRATGKVKWLAVIDLDEFIVPVHCNNLRELLKGYENNRVGGVCINWNMYGTSNVCRVPANRLMIETLLQRAPKDTTENFHVKSIIRPERVRGCINPHFFLYKDGFFQVTTNKRRFEGPHSPTVSNDKIRLNHYWSRDKHYFRTVKLARRRGWGDNNAQFWINRMPVFNQERDDIMMRFVLYLKQRIAIFNRVHAQK